MFFHLLLQADTLVPTPPAAAPASETLSLFGLLKEGGVLMIPLLICSILMVYIFTERFMAIRKAAALDPSFMQRIRDFVASGNLQAARSTSKATPGPVPRMIDKGLARIGKPVDNIERSMETTGRIELYNLEKNLGILSTLASIAPMFGFLGTIFGMIRLFFDIQHKGFEIQSIAGGIYTKMVTSAVGLIIGLLSYMGYKYLTAQIARQENRLEAAGAEFLDVLHEPVKS